MRLFIALYPTKEYLDYFRDVMRAFAKEKRNLKPIDIEQVHLTLRFVGAKVSGASKNAIANEILRDRKSTRLNSSHSDRSRMPSSA